MQLTNFSYKIIDSNQKGKKKVSVTFDYNNQKITYFLLLKINKKFSDKNYIDKAKDIISAQINNGALMKYAKKYLKKNHISPNVFKDFTYAVVPSSMNGYKEVQVIFTYKKHRVTTYCFVNEEANKDKEYYINKAKQQIKQEINDGTLLREAKAFVQIESGSSNKGLKAAIACASVAALTFGGLFLYYRINGNGIGTGGGGTPVVDDKLSITVDPNGGTLNTGESGIKIFKVEPNSTWSELGVSVTPPSGLTPDGWDYSEIGGTGWTHITSDITFTANTTVKAKYNGQISSHTVTYNLNYDSLTDQRSVDDGEKAPKPGTDFPAPVRENYTLDTNWYNEAGCTTIFNFNDAITADKEIFAKWNPVSETVVINPNGGTFNDDTTITKTLSISYGTTWEDVKSAHSEIAIKTNPVGTEDGYKYTYYDVATDNWVELTDTYTISSNLSIKVEYTKLSDTLSFADEQGGSSSLPSPRIAVYGNRWIDIKNQCLPTVKTGYEFDHYYIKNQDETVTEVTDSYVFDGTAVTFYAAYNVTITFDNDPTKGTIDSHAQFAYGTKWEDVKDDYTPVEIDPDKFTFSKFTDGSEADVTDTYEITKSDTFTAVYIESTGEADNFQLDPWPVFLNEISKYDTIEALGGEDSPYHDDYTEGDNSFVAAQRSLNVGGREYTVRVVDEHDRADSGDGSLFTFDFAETLYPDLIYNRSGEGNGFADSALNNYLNVDLIESFPEEVKEEIKTKPVKYYDDGSSSVITTNAKLYPLSASEMGFTEYPPTQGGGEGGEVIDEGAALDYYYNIGSESNRRRKARIGDGDFVPYWLRSADINNPECVWLVNDSDNTGLGKYDEELDIYVSEYYDRALAVAPAFEI